MSFTLADIARHSDAVQNSSSSGSALARFIARSLGEGDGDEPRVTASTVRGLPGAWNSICKIAGHLGVMPCRLKYRPKGKDAETASWHPGDRVINLSPSRLMNPAIFRETIQHHVLLHGNGRAYIVRNGRMEPQELIIMRPNDWAVVVVQPEQTDEHGVIPPAKKYHVAINDPSWVLPDVDVLHIAGLSDDGITGIGVIEAAKQALGLAIAQQTRSFSQEKNGARLRFLIKAPQGAFKSEADAKAFIDGFNDYHSGAANADKVGLLRNGLEVVQISQTNQESQSIESRRFSRQDIALLFQVEQMLGDSEAQYAGNNEAKARAYIDNCLMRWITRWEQECAAKLLTEAQFQSGEWYFKFNTAALLRGTTEERYRVYTAARQIGTLSPNEIRELEDMPKRTDPGGDSYDNPQTTAGGQQPTQQAAAQHDQQAVKPANDARLREIIAKNVARVVGVERSRVERAAATEANFCGWLSTFYATWTDRVASVVADCGGDAALATTWAGESTTRLLDVAGRVTADKLSEAVRSEVATWEQRVDTLTETIINTGAANHGA